MGRDELQERVRVEARRLVVARHDQSQFGGVTPLAVRHSATAVHAAIAGCASYAAPERGLPSGAGKETIPQPALDVERQQHVGPQAVELRHVAVAERGIERRRVLHRRRR